MWNFGTLGIFSLLVFLNICARSVQAAEPRTLKNSAAYRGPVDLHVMDGEVLALTINELSNSVSLIDLASGQVLDEMQVGAKPCGLCEIGPHEVLVSCRNSGELYRIQVSNEQIEIVARIPLAMEPHGLASHGDQAFVGCRRLVRSQS